jgi:Class III cytochrome C family
MGRPAIARAISRPAFGTTIVALTRRSRRSPHFRRHALNAHVTTIRVRLVFLAALAAGGVLVGGPLHAQAPKEPDTVVLPAAPGPVTLNHKAHTTTNGAKCDACHHPSKAEKALKAPNQKCGDCHTKAAAAPMKTKLQAAFHDPMAKKGTCVDCHQQAAAKGNKKAPAKCADCHKK